jgi:UDP-GlcNAc:undecaprenyl-phosphate GlcNAc-1-phosphate transferase
MEVGALDYVAVFVGTLALTLFLTPVAVRLAVRRSVLDHPNAIKTQASPVPYLGGLAIVVAFATVVLVAALVRRPAPGFTELGVILALAVALAVVGLLDDLRGLSPWLRLGLEIGAGLVVWATPAGATVFSNNAVDAVVTVVWVVGVTNALNLLDNMDGLSAGVSAIAAGSIFVVAEDNGQFLVATLAIALAACAVGFLRSNFHPARIYMGDAGALFLGFMLAVLALKLEFPEQPKSVSLFVPVLLLGIPLFDTTLVTLNRLRHRRSPMSGGRDHTSHRIVFIGIPVPIAVALIYVASASLGVLAFVVSREARTTAFVLIAWAASIAAMFGALLSAVPVYETSRRQRVMLLKVERDEEPRTVVDPHRGERPA